jgi:hypothetical protein
MVFTKYDQFKREISSKLEDKGHDPTTYLEHEAETLFRKQYLATLMGPPLFVRLESEKLCSQLS